MTERRLFIFGLGYTSRAVAREAAAAGWSVSGTVRTLEKAEALRAEGLDAVVFDGTRPAAEVGSHVSRATHVLSSIAPPRASRPNADPDDAAADPVLAHHGSDLARAPRLSWLGYLSTIGVYGDAGGGWIDETAPPDPTQARAVRRVAAEEGWRALARSRELSGLVLRLGGIYGPGRSQLDAVREGRARRIVKQDQVFNRIHVEDIARIVLAAARREGPGILTLNAVDDLPAPPQDVVAFAAALLKVAPPPEIPFAQVDLSPMARQFYGVNRRVANAALKAELGIALRHPTYREGLRAVLAAEDTHQLLHRPTHGSA